MEGLEGLLPYLYVFIFGILMFVLGVLYERVQDGRRTGGKVYPPYPWPDPPPSIREYVERKGVRHADETERR